ncbi:MAG: hypothetical protein QW336_03235 [Candidatus Anstonellales archaeon]
MIYIPMILLIVFTSGIYIETISSDKVIYRPGDTAVITVNGVILYSSTTDPPKRLSQAIIEGTTSFGTYTANIGTFELQNGVPQRFSRVLSINIPSNLNEGVYILDIKLNGFLDTEKQSGRIVNSFGSVPIRVETKRELRLEIKDKVLFDRGESELQICTNANVKNIRIRGLYLVSEYYIENLFNCSNLRFEYIIGKNRTGDIDFPIEVSYETSLNNRYTDAFVFKINVEQSPSNIKIEQIGNLENNLDRLKLVVKYEGSDELRDVKIYSRGPIQFIKPNYLNIPELRNGSVIQLDVDTFYSGTTGVIPNEFTITYISNGATRSITLLLPIRIFNRANLDVYLDYNNLIADTQNTINVVIGNVESYNIQGVRIRLDSEDAKVLTSQRFVGEIITNDYASERFTIIPKEGLNRLSVSVYYRDSAGNQYEQNYNFEIVASKTISKEPQTSPVIFVVGAILILVIIYLAYRKWIRK